MNVVVRTRQGWFSRIGGSIKGFFFGLLMVFGAIALLAWNEHRTVKTRKGLDQGAAAVVVAPLDRVDPALAGRLVHVSGPTRTQAGSMDPEFQLRRDALALQRTVEMYQWREKKTERKEKNAGGSETTVTEYSYTQGWADELIDSSRFHQPAGHANPSRMPLRSQRYDAPDAQLGAYRLSASQLGAIGAWRDLLISDLPPNLRSEGWGMGVNGELYRGLSPSSPRVGDLRVRYRELPPSTISVVAQQEGNGLMAWTAPNGVTVDLLDDGTRTAAELFAQAQSSNATLAWVLRGAGCLMMWVGFGMLLNPLRVLADVIPPLGRVVGFAGGLVSFVLTAVLALTVIAISWLVARPLLVISVLAVGVGGFLLLGQLKARRAAPMPPPIAYPPGAYIPDPPRGSPPPPPPPRA